MSEFNIYRFLIAGIEYLVTKEGVVYTSNGGFALGKIAVVPDNDMLRKEPRNEHDSPAS
jgi:hypothetical protein